MRWYGGEKKMNWSKKELEDGNVEIYYFNEKEPLVSVITTCKKGEPDLENLKSALLKQTFKDFEFIVTHRGKNIAEGYNTGVRYSRGEIIVFTETDCIPKENWLEELIEELKKYGKGNVVLGSTSASYMNMSSVAMYKSDYAPQRNLYIENDTEWYSHLKHLKKKIIFTNNKGIVIHNRTRRTYRNQLKIAFVEAYYCPRIHKMYGKDSIVSPWIFFLSYCFQSLVLFMRFLGLFAGIVRWKVIEFYGYKKKFE